MILPSIGLDRRTCTVFVLSAALTSSAAAQDHPEPRPSASPPTISARTYTDGSVKVTVTGGLQIDADIPINTRASMSDGEMTWLQYGVSGAKEPNALITVSPQEIGLSAGQGKQMFTIDAASCKGTMKVTATMVAGRYTCGEVTGYDGGTGKMSTVKVVIDFSARS